MIIDERDFIEEIDEKFWKQLTKETQYRDPFDYVYIEKEDYLLDIAEKINNHSYTFSKPTNYYLYKGKGIYRKLKLHNLSDTTLYYYAMKKLQRDLIEEIKKNENVYGHFKISDYEERVEEECDECCEEDLGYNSKLSKGAYKKHWSEYQNRAYEMYEDEELEYYIHIDINHFYNNISLPLLESRVRRISKESSKFIDLLFYFLKYSDISTLGYFPSSVGIPQQEIGDMSRLLANFYLSSFDDNMLKKLENKRECGLNYKYIRYSDDIWVGVGGEIINGENSTYNIIKEASNELDKLKLHINEKKLKVLNKTEFLEHWKFEKLEDVKESSEDPDYLLTELFRMLEDKRGRSWSVARYIFAILLNKHLEFLKEKKNFLPEILKYPKLIEGMELEKVRKILEIIDKKALELLKELVKKGEFETIAVKIFVFNLLINSKYSRAIEAILVNELEKIVDSEEGLESENWYLRCLIYNYIIKNYSKIHDRKLEIIKKCVLRSDYLKNLNEIEEKYLVILALKLGIQYKISKIESYKMVKFYEEV